jgi:hypothetical protein
MLSAILHREEKAYRMFGVDLGGDQQEIVAKRQTCDQCLVEKTWLKGSRLKCVIMSCLR